MNLEFDNDTVKQGYHPSGGRRGPFQNKKSSVSVGAAGRPGPADPADPAMGLHFFYINVASKTRNVTHLCFDLILPDSRLAEIHRYCHTGVGYRSSFPVPPEFLSSYHFFHLHSS